MSDTSFKIPLCTYRVQLSPAFGFESCRSILPYLEQLGVSHIYASPLFKCRPGSAHGYDVCDHLQLNPELGTEKEFTRLMAEVKSRGMGWIQDIVPNHMAVSGANRMLVDVLENGPASRFFSFFDIEWDHPYENMHGRMLAPFLGSFYNETLERGEIRIGFDEDGFFVRYYELRFPLCLDSYNSILTLGLDALRRKLGRDHIDYVKLLGILYNIKSLPEEAQEERYDQIFFIKRMLFELYDSSADVRAFLDANLERFNGAGRTDGSERKDPWRLLDNLLAEQYFRLSFWKVAGDEINYRRFFSINDLISLRVEDEAVFDYTHRFILDKVRSGEFGGLRVDHVDGLYDPTGYLRRLREQSGGVYLVVEKILSETEPLPGFWPVQGTTGYDFLNRVCGLFVDKSNGPAFDQIYTSFTSLRRPLGKLLAQKKHLIVERNMAGDVDNMARLVKMVAGKDRRAFDITLNALREAITELLVQFPVYRTYISNDTLRSQDLGFIRATISTVRRRKPELKQELDFLERFLLLDFGEGTSEEDRRKWVQFVMRFQQVTGPLQAKGLEDTVFYVMNRLLCLNEVGGWPGSFGLDPQDLHAFVTERAQNWPHAMNATATHDTKRGEDARMRLAALSEMPEIWQAALKRFNQLNARKRRQVEGRPAPGLNDEYFLYQSLLAHWPWIGREPDSDELQAFGNRLKSYLIKSVREAKDHSAWISPDEEYEQAYLAFAGALLRPGRNAFLKEFFPLKETVARTGLCYSLGQILLKLTVPGVPDIYQGTEFWNYDFVDPDNRRPVDFRRRSALLDNWRNAYGESAQTLAETLLAQPEDGGLKLFALWRTLQTRRKYPGLFQEGAYLPVGLEGARVDRLFGFLRQLEHSWALVLVPRLVAGICDTGFPMGKVWENTQVVLPDLPAGRQGKTTMWRCCFTDAQLPATTLAVGDFLRFPVGLWILE